MNKTKNEIFSALEKNIPKEEIVIKRENPSGPSDAVLIKDSEEDFAIARENVKKLLTTSDEAIATLMNIASDAEHPRAFEVLANLIKTASDVNKQLVDLQKERKKILRSDNSQSQSNPSVTNNAIFIGTTADLQKHIKDSIGKVIDIDK